MSQFPSDILWQTASVITSFILAMVLHPHIQKRAQAELDEVVGNRLPDFADRRQLPYMECIVSESLRWNPVTNLSVWDSDQLIQTAVSNYCF